MTNIVQIIKKRKSRKLYKQQRQFRDQMGLVILLFITLFGLLLPLSVVIGAVGITYSQAVQLLPDSPIAAPLEPILGETRLYDASEQTLLLTLSDPVGDNNGWIALEDMPETVWRATLLWEDPNFLSDTGFNPFSLIENWWRNRLTGPLEENSTIVGRLVRNILLSPQTDAIEGRALEMAMIAELHRRYTPEQLLEWHINTNYYGNEAYGIEAAAQLYLGKSATDLTLDEAALLVAIATAPQFNPIDDETAARGRQSDLLRRMLVNNIITASEFEAIAGTQTPIRTTVGQTPLIAPEFVVYARKQAERILTSLGLDGVRLVSRGGLKIVTTLDLDLYYQTECTLRTHLGRLSNPNAGVANTLTNTPCIASSYLPEEIPATNGTNPPDTGIVFILDPNTGEILAMVGDATKTQYQPSVTLHPLVYLDGFFNPNPNYTASTMLLDIPRPFPGAVEGSIYIPTNPDGRFRGPLSLRDAMGASLLPPVTQVANVLNLNTVLRRTINRVGINSLRSGLYDLSLLERGGAVSVLDVGFVYGTLAALGDANGLRITPIAPGLRDHDPLAIRRIESNDGEILWEYNETERQLSRVPVIESQLAYVINDILSDRTTRWETLGQGNILETTRQTAVINGMSSDRVDNWTVGYTPQIVTVVQLGRVDRSPTSLDPFATAGAAMVWRAVMDYTHARDALPIVTWERPQTLITAVVCEISGMSPNDACRTREEIFLDIGQLPQQDTYWQLVEINTQTRLRASINTPSSLRAQVPYFIPPPEAMDWWRANNQPLPPVEYDAVNITQADLGSTVILQPRNFDVVGDVVDVRGSLDASNFEFYQLSYGQGPNPTEWINLTDAMTTFTAGTSLAQWDTNTLDGTYVLQLRVVKRDGTTETGFSQVTVDNIPPAIVLRAGEPNQVFRWTVDTIIPVTAEVSDNIRVSRVDFYLNGQFIATVGSYPYVYNHPINRPGIETFTAVAYDAVENNSTAETSVEVIRTDG
ncbi:MAG: penicillin-binding protein [bacterium]|nr:penicillin-binding protein [bacterium]